MAAELTNWIQVAWQILERNHGWMAWNLFLAFVPLVMCFWLFHRPRSRWLRWSSGILLGATFVIGVNRYDWRHLRKLIGDLQATYSQLDTIYLVGAIAIVLGLMALDFWVLRGRETRSIRWWLGFFIFIAFLPNAPYVLTDIIHLIDNIRENYSVWIITLAIVPLYLLFMILGFEAYVLCLIYLGDYLKERGWSKYIPWVELIIHGLSAIGIYLGRFQRFNSWHILTQPEAIASSFVNDLVGKRPALVMAVTFVVIAALYWLMKQVTLGIMERQRRAIATADPTSKAESSIQ